MLSSKGVLNEKQQLWPWRGPISDPMAAAAAAAVAAAAAAAAAAFTASFILSRIPILISAPFEDQWWQEKEEEENKKAIFLFLIHFRGGLDKKKENDLNLNL